MAAEEDEVISVDDLKLDAEGAALLESLQAQIATQLGVDSEEVNLHNIQAQAVGGQRLAEYTIDRLGEILRSTTISSTYSQALDTVPSLNRDEYYTVPSLHELQAMPVAALKKVSGFRVGRAGFGEVRWLGETDVTGLDLDDIVSIEHGDVSVYRGQIERPEVGEKLNKPAVLVLEQILPPDGISAEDFAEELNRMLESAGASSVDYNAVSGILKFIVPHFAEEDSESEAAVEQEDESSTQWPLLPPGVYTRPANLHLLSDAHKATMKDFTVGKVGFGEISFDVEQFSVSDLRELDLRNALRFSGTANHITNVELYPHTETKPEVGTELNKPATITVFFDKQWSDFRIREVTEQRDGVTFVAYDRATKMLKFQVSHFTEYGLFDEEESTESPVQEMGNARRQLANIAWTGALCQIEVDPCTKDENDCDTNYAECVHIGVGVHECVCHAGYETTNGGRSCTNIIECSSSPCMNSGTCKDGSCTAAACMVAYTCTCAAGYTGVHCEMDINECASYPCKHGATCVDAVYAFACICNAGYAGYNCDVDIDECNSVPCLNSASCTDSSNARVVADHYSCSCAAGFSGVICETDADECASSPCLHGGTCSQGVNSYTCSCSDGYKDLPIGTCLTELDECASDPCRNGGTCFDHVFSYTCVCSRGFSGYNCELNDNDCLSSPCQNGSTCTDAVDKYTCTCAPSWAGKFCENEVDPCGKTENDCDKDLADCIHVAWARTSVCATLVTRPPTAGEHAPTSWSALRHHA